MEHFFQDIQGWSDRLTQLYDFVLPQLPKNCQIVESGVWVGRSTAFLAVELINRGHQFKLVSVDHWQGAELTDNEKEYYSKELETRDPYQEFLTNIEPVKDHIQICKMSSLDAAKLFDDQSFDFVVIDDDHSYTGALNNISAWIPKVKSGGFVSGDDFDWPGVEQAVRELFGDRFSTIGGAAWYIQL